jgi:hypothetical protein
LRIEPYRPNAAKDAKHKVIHGENNPLENQ